MAGRTLPMHERIHLVTNIFSDRNEVEKVGNLCGDDAQALVNVIDEVSPTLFDLRLTGGLTPTKIFSSY